MSPLSAILPGQFSLSGPNFCTWHQQLWRGSFNFKIRNSIPLFTIIFKPKIVPYSSSSWCGQFLVRILNLRSTLLISKFLEIQFFKLLRVSKNVFKAKKTKILDYWPLSRDGTRNSSSLDPRGPGAFFTPRFPEE